MSEKINMFLATEFEYRRGLAHKLLDEGIIDFCLAAINPYTHLPEEHDRIVTVNTNPSGDDEYWRVCDINELPALSKDILEKMLPYESMALKMGDRRAFSMPISEYADEKRKYLQHVRYWNYMLDKYNINLIVHACTPHSQGMYVVYGLAQVKGIPTLIYERNGFFLNRKFWGDSINSIGNGIEAKYKQLKDINATDFELDDDIERDYFNFLNNKHDTLNKSRKIGSGKNGLKNDMKNYYYSKLKEYYYEYIRYNLRAKLKPETIQDLKNREVWFRLRKKQLKSFRYYIYNQTLYADEYNKMAESPDCSKKYICFFPQVYPEQTIIPRAGVFAEQYTSIQLLARAAEKAGCYVYVREHPASSNRPYDFYSEFKSIKNVVLIKSEGKSSEIMKNSVAVATQTGSCIFEAAILGKPAIVLSEGHLYKGCPNVFEMTDEDQGAELIRSLINGFSLSEEDLRRYMYAIQMESIMEVDLESEFRRLFNNSYVEPPFPLDDRTELIKSFINDHIGNEKHKISNSDI